MKFSEKFLRDNQHGLFALMSLGIIFFLALGFYLVRGPGGQNPGISELETDQNLAPKTKASLVRQPAGDRFRVNRDYQFLSQPPIWNFQDQERVQKDRLSLSESQRFYTATGLKTPISEKYEVDLYDFSDNPETHLHVRQVDHNELGYGKGLKIAIEIIEPF